MIKRFYSDILPNNIYRLLLIVVLGLSTFSAARGQSLTITASASLSEINLDAEYLTLDLGAGETFRDYTSLHLKPDSFVLIGAPAGTSVESVVGNSATQAQINLAFDGTDFDIDHSLSVDIDFSILTITASGYLSSSNSEPVDAYEESAAIDDPSLNETDLDGQSVTVSLTEETFHTPVLLDPGNFILNNAPPGITIAGFESPPTSTEAVLDLQFIPGDFDVDFTGFSITVVQSVLSQSDADLTTNAITISHSDESAAIDDPVLNEAALDGQAVTITLSDETFADLILDPGNFTLNNGPAGLTIESFTGVTTTTAVVNLAFTPGDFDGNYTTFSISIDPLELTQTSDLDLTSNAIAITAAVESASINDPVLNEADLDGQAVTITLSNETFADLILDPGNFTLNNAPVGLTIESFTGVTTTSAIVNLAFTPGDFDGNFTNFSISIDPSELAQTSDLDLTSNAITITAAVESASINDPGLNEAVLDGQAVTITLSDETFADLLLDAGNFTLNNAPVGLTIESFTGVTTTSAIVNLAFIPGDFDVNFTNFSISIDPSELAQTSDLDLTSNAITITTAVESAAIDDPGLNEAVLDGQAVTITLSDETFADLLLDAGNFTLNNGPAGLTIESFTGVTTTSAVVNLAFTPGDFDGNYTTFSISIDPLELSQTSDLDLTSNAITITAAVESAAIDDPGLNEAALDGQAVTITLSNETFADLLLDAGNFTLNNAPVGLTIESFTGVTTTSAVVNLAFTPGDFDGNYTTFSISIDPLELSQTSDLDLTSNAITITAAVESAAIDDPGLNEADLDGQAVTVTLSNETFADLLLDAGNFTLNNAPVGLTIESFTGVTTTSAVVNLAFTPGDFDGNYTTFSISIDPLELSQTSDIDLTSNAITITALIESASMSASPPLNELTLNGQSVTITLTNETYDDPLDAVNFTLGGTQGVNYPVGLSIGSVSRTSATAAAVTLAFDESDFDADFTDFYITVAEADLVQTSTGVLTPGNRLTISAFGEVPQATMTADSNLEERRLDARAVTIDLIQESFHTPGSLDPGNFTLNDAPGGLSIVGFIGTPAPTQVVLDLQFIPGDFDTDFPGFSITIDQSVLVQAGADLITSNSLPVLANTESATLAPGILNENSLDGSILTITLVNEFFGTTGSVDPVNFDLDNEPVGYTIAGAIISSATQAQLTMQYTGADFDVDIPNFRVGVVPGVLRFTSDENLYTNLITIQAYVEDPSAHLNPDVALYEGNLDARQLFINLVEERFVNPAGLLPGNFIPVDAPPGLTIASMVGTPTSTNASLVLSFDGTDFDVQYPDFHILIDNSVLVQSAEDLATDSLLIDFGLEPVITGVGIPNETMRIGSVVPVTITVENDMGNTYSLDEGAVIGGYPLTGLTRVDETTYTCIFTVEEGGLDYAAPADIHVQMRMWNGGIQGPIYLGYIIQDNDLLDAHRPVIQYIYTSMGGAQNIGSLITMFVYPGQTGLTFTPASHVNNIPITSPTVNIIEAGGGRYNLTYLVQEGDANVATGELSVSMEAVDMAGNISVPASIDPNTLSIDASRPVITRAYVSSSDDDIAVGETIEITVVADQSGYRNLAGSWINNVFVSPGHLTFTDLGNNSYLYAYTVQEGDGTVDRGNLAINIALQDAAPFSNTSLAFTGLDPNNVQIVTSKPSATISGSTSICEGESATLTVVLGGTPPWTMDISDGSTISQHSSTGSTYTFSVSPEVTTVYRVDRVVDGTGNFNGGAGQATVTLPNFPSVQILNLQPLYDVLSAPEVLEYTPAGGTFRGPGMSTSPPWTFSPSSAGTENSPHEIVYTITDPQTSCTSSDIKIVSVVSGSGHISFEKEFACFNDSTFLLTGVNTAENTGSFEAKPIPPAGAFVDNGNNTATLRPYLYDLAEDRAVTFEYTFTDEVGTEITVTKILTIEYLDDAVIYEPPSLDPCQNEDLIDLNGNYNEMTSGYSFTGPAVVDNDSGSYYFDPQSALLGPNTVVYEYVSARRCRVSDMVVFNVADAPDAGFIAAEPCVSLDGGTVQFISRSDTGQAVSWYWEFGDPSSGTENNRSILENPEHHYSDTGSYTITQIVRIGNCEDLAQKTINLKPKPEADFTMSSSCQSNVPVLLNGQETVYGPDTVSVWTWTIDSDGTEIFRSDTTGRQFSYAFPSVGTYVIGYTVKTAAGCIESINRTVSLSRTYVLSPDNPFSEDFESEDHGWVKMPNTLQNSWTVDEVDPMAFPVTAASGTHAWYTDLPVPATPENSWVISPCFNFEAFNRPMVSLDIKQSLDRDRDGAALQYTIDNGHTWHNVGDVDDGGVNWYNSTSIYPAVGNTNTGWTGALIPSEEDDQWHEVVRGLDEVIGEPEVRFRVAFGTLGDIRTETNEGFAFDNFRIGQRTRVSVLEYFTNANNAECFGSDTVIMQIMNQVPADVIDIQYHATVGSLPDKFYNDNSVPANSRGTIYGVAGIPFAILDGNFMTYDFSGNLKTPNVKDIRRRSLMKPDFKLTITVSQYTPTLEFSIDIEALKSLERKERSLYAIVLQRKVEDPTYWGTNGMKVFRQVARKMLPNSAGYYLGYKSWIKGENENAVLTWETPYLPLIDDSLSIVVFVQDDDTREILQAASNPQYVTSTFDGLELPSQVLIYPNPAREAVNVYFEESPGEEMRFALYDLSGKLVITDVIEPWQQLYTRSLADVEQGMYILEIRSRDRRRVLYRDKLLHY